MGKKHITRKCHWVPQSYLRGFAANEERTKIWRLSKHAGEPELKSIKKVTVRFNLYITQNEDGSRDDNFERKLSELEQWFASPIWRALQSDFVDLGSMTHRKMVSLLAATMFLRNPKNFEQTRNIHGQLVSLFSGPEGPPTSIEINSKLFEIDVTNWPEYQNASEDDIKRLWIGEINNAAYYATLFMAMRWSIVRADRPVFITTDNPVVFFHPSLRFRGIRNPETSVMFPISPTTMLCMDNRHNEPANQYYPLKGDGVPQNFLLWRGCIEHMFSHRMPDEICMEMNDDYERQGFSWPDYLI